MRRQLFRFAGLGGVARDQIIDMRALRGRHLITGAAGIIANRHRAFAQIGPVRPVIILRLDPRVITGAGDIGRGNPGKIAFRLDMGGQRIKRGVFIDQRAQGHRDTELVGQLLGGLGEQQTVKAKLKEGCARIHFLRLQTRQIREHVLERIYRTDRRGRGDDSVLPSRLGAMGRSTRIHIHRLDPMAFALERIGGQLGRRGQTRPVVGAGCEIRPVHRIAIGPEIAETLQHRVMGIGIISLRMR